MRSDGLVLATPAGSTGYNLANGGPVMAWGVEGFAVSFIAPHSLTARALVVAPDDEVTVHNRSQSSVDVTLDGRPAGALGPGQSVSACYRARRRRARAGPGLVVLSPPARKVRQARGLTATTLRRRRAQGPGPSAAAGRPSARAAGAARREPPADRAGRAAPRPGAERADGGDGAGKTVLAHALDLLLGGRPRAGHRAPRGGRGLRRGHVRAAERLRARLGERLAARTRRRSCWRAA